MAHIQWKDSYNIHFREIDAQHQGLLGLLNELMDLVSDQGHPEQVARIFRDLGEYTRTHFSSEERYLEAAQYPGLPQHRQEHAAFVARLTQLTTTYDPGDPQLVDQALIMLRRWFLEHITKSDQDYAPFLRKALPTEPIEAVLFGLDGVMCTRDLTPLLQLITSQSGKTESEVRLGMVETPGLLFNLESGAWNAERFVSELAAWTGSPLSEEALIKTYGECFRPVPALVQLALRLKAHQPVALVGDATPWMWAHKLPKLDLHTSFSAEAFSCDAGARLPDQALLLKAAACLGLPPAACLFIHQDSACLDAAQAAGMQTLHYTWPVMLMAELRHLGVAF